MSRKTWLFLGAALAGCSGISVEHDYDPNVDFSRFKTWAWAPPQPQADGSDFSRVSNLTMERIHGAVERELTGKGYPTSEPDKADFWVQHYAAVGQRVEPYAGYNHGWYGDDIIVTEEGTIVVDFISPKDRRLVWRGTARSAIDEDMTPEDRESRIREAVKEILAQFPPKKS
jgi:hypothetical protein